MDIDFSLAIEQLNKMVTDLITYLPYYMIALLVFLLFYLFGLGIRKIVQTLSERYRRHKNLAYILGRLAQWFVIILGLLIAMVIAFPNFSPAQMIQLLGLGGIAIGFAFRDILENFLAGILLLITNAFSIGDQIVIDDVEGTVEDIETRATTLVTYDGRRVVIPNADLFTSRVTVNTAYDQRRIEYDIVIGYDEKLYRVKQMILATVQGISGVLTNPPPDVLVVDLAEYGVKVRVRWWIRPPRRVDYLTTQDEVLMAVLEKLQSEKVNLPYPTQLLHVSSSGQELPNKEST